MCDIGQHTDHAYLSMRDLVSHSHHAHDEHPCNERSLYGCNGCCGWVTPAKFSEYLGFEIVLFITKPLDLLSHYTRKILLSV